jgi:hypothetical protein
VEGGCRRRKKLSVNIFILGLDLGLCNQDSGFFSEAVHGGNPVAVPHANLG